MRPPNPSSLRSSPVTIGSLNVAGVDGVGSSAGSSMCAAITASAPGGDAGLERRQLDRVEPRRADA